MKWKLSKFTEVVNIFDKEKDDQISLLFNTRNEKFSFLSEKYFAYLLHLGELGQLPKKQFEEIKNFIVQDNCNEFDDFIRENLSSGTFFDVLRYTIMISGNCNFKCCYCGQDHENVYLSDNYADEICKQIDRKLSKGTFKTLKISWFGGEPLLALNQMVRMTHVLRKICERHNVKYVGTITTNAYLMDRNVAERLISELDITQFFITIDGKRSDHDKRRCLKNGHGTFDIVYKNFIDLLYAARKANKVSIILRCNVDLKNKGAIFNLIDLLAADNVQQFKNLSIIIAPIHNWGNDAGNNALSRKEFADLETKAYAKLIDLDFKVTLLPKRRYGMCPYVDINSEVIDPYGNVFPCSELGLVKTYEMNGENKYKIGHIMQPGRKDRFKLFQEYDLYGDNMAICRNCTIFPSCYGACPKQWHDGIVPCPTAKINLKQKMLLFYIYYKRRLQKS